MLIPFLVYNVSAETVPDWIKTTALWYGTGEASEAEFLDMIKFLIENDIILLENETATFSENLNATILIPNGNSGIEGTGFYLPLNLEVSPGTNVTWANEDNVVHTIQSQNKLGDNSGLFHSSLLETGDKFEYTFEEEGVYNYYCSLHPWRIGLVTVR